MLSVCLITFASALAFISLGGGLYEFLVVDPYWPRRPDLIQPSRGGINRKRFWIPAHTAFEVVLLLSLWLTWPQAQIRGWLLAGLASHAVMRLWSAFDFIPKALAFERTDPATIAEPVGRRWTRRSLCRLPLDLVTCGTLAAGAAAAVRLV
jgi:hypothetical protein